MAGKIGILEGLTSFTAKSITELMGSETAKKGIGWLTGQKVNEILVDEQKSKLLEEKMRIIDQKSYDSRKEAEDGKCLSIRFIHAERDIGHTFQLLQTILANRDSSAKRNFQVEQLQNEISYPKLLCSLSVIHQVLVGRNDRPSEKGLLQLKSNELTKEMHENPMSAKTCYGYWRKYLTETAILQFKGFLLFHGANDNAEICAKHFKLFEKNLKSQSSSMHDSMPTHMTCMKYLANPKEEDIFYLRPVMNAPFNPFVKRRGTGKALLYEYCLENVTEEIWNLEKTSTFNTDGSLYISGILNKNDGAKRSYISVNEKNEAICVSKEDKPQPFYLIPSINGKSVIIRKVQAEKDSPCFLGNSLKCVKKADNIKFTMTKPADITDKEIGWLM